MRSRILILLVIYSIISTGCSFSPKHSSGIALEPENQISYVKKGRIINIDRIKTGGNLLILPFSPDVDVVVNEVSDQASLMLIRGIVDVFEKEKPKNLNLIYTERAEIADLILSGRIVRIDEGSLLKGNKKSIKVKGKILESSTNYTMAVFEDTVEATDKTQDYKNLAQTIGQNIGNFIIDASQN